MEGTIKISSYTTAYPKEKCKVKVAVKTKEILSSTNPKDNFKTDIYEDAIYEPGFVSLDGGKSFYLASNFIFHKLKRQII